MNCLFIILDATHAAHLSAWGYSRETTPNLDALAAQGARFERAFSQGPSTRPSNWSYLSGLYPIPSARDGTMVLGNEIVTLAESFSHAGYKTFGLSENFFVSEQFGFDQGFDHFETMLPMIRKDFLSRNNEASAYLLDEAFKQISLSEASPWFGYVHLFRPHAPYLAPEPYGRHFMVEPDRTNASVELEQRIAKGELTLEMNESEELLADITEYLVASYDGNLRYADHLVGEHLNRLREQGALKNTVVIIASDHGESFMQHGEVGHGDLLYEEYFHVPLIIWAESMEGFQPGVVDTPVALIDLYPTLVELCGLDSRDDLDGESLLPFLQGSSRPGASSIFAQTLEGDKVSMRAGRAKLIVDLNPETNQIVSRKAFELGNDPGETVDLSRIAQIQEGLGRLQGMIEEYIGQWPAERPAGRELREDEVAELEAVGYIR